MLQKKKIFSYCSFLSLSLRLASKTSHRTRSLFDEQVNRHVSVFQPAGRRLQGNTKIQKAQSFPLYRLSEESQSGTFLKGETVQMRFVKPPEFEGSSRNTTGEPATCPLCCAGTVARSWWAHCPPKCAGTTTWFGKPNWDRTQPPRTVDASLFHTQTRADQTLVRKLIRPPVHLKTGVSVPNEPRCGLFEPWTVSYTADRTSQTQCIMGKRKQN